MFKGTYTAIVTPFKGGRIDEDGFRKLIDFQIDHGIDGIVPVGTTGEAATLDYDEHLRVIEIAVQQDRCGHRLQFDERSYRTDAKSREAW